MRIFCRQDAMTPSTEDRRPGDFDARMNDGFATPLVSSHNS